MINNLKMFYKKGYTVYSYVDTDDVGIGKRKKS